MLKRIQKYVCPNPNCQKSFENLIIVHDKSKIPVENFYACPYCFFKLDPTVINSLKKIQEFIEVKINPKLTSEKNISNCPHYFGYLSKHFNDSIILKKCLDCEKMSKCLESHDDKQKIIKDDYVA